MANKQSMKAIKLSLTLLFAIFTFTYSYAQCRDLKIDARNSIIYVNCGGIQRVITGQSKIIEFLNEINSNTEKIIDLMEQKKDNNEDVEAEIRELKEYMTIVYVISIQIKNIQENANKITKGAVERLIYRGFFFEACSIVEENKNQSEFGQLRMKSCTLQKYLEYSEQYYDSNKFVMSLKYADSIKVVGDKMVSYNFTKKLFEAIKGEFMKVAQTDIITKFDDINCPSCAFQKTRSPGYLDIFDTFSQIYNFKPEDYPKWYESDLKWFVKYFSNESELKGIHSEVLYKICFMFHHDFSDINKKKVKFKQQWLSILINLSIEVNYRQSDLNKKLDLRKSVLRD